VQKEPKSLPAERVLVWKYTKKSFAAGVRPRIPLGSLKCSTKLLLDLGTEHRERKGDKEKRGKGRKGESK